MKDAIYFPVLRGKLGEINAVAALRPATRAGIRPMFDIPTPDEDGEATASLSMATSSLARTWGTTLPLYLDLSRHDPDALVESKSTVVHLFDCARQAGLMAIPVSAPVRDRRGHTGAYLDGVASIARKDQRGVALRIDYDYFSDVDSIEALIDESMRAVGSVEEATDIILDSGPLEKLPLGTPLSRSLMLAYSTALLALDGRHFRNMVICASSIPRRVPEMQNGVPHRVPNNEFTVWSQLVGQKSNRTLKFSDYGARYAHQKDGGGGARPPARVQLVTAGHHHLYLDKPDRYRELCAAAAQNEEFSLQPWGTRIVRDCALGSGSCGGGTEWVERDTLMHLETMAASARSRLAELGVLVTLELPVPERIPHDQAELHLPAGE